MSNLVEFASRVAKLWSNKTLEEFRVEAEREDIGIMSSSIRAVGGERLIIAICITDVDQIARVEAKLDLVDDGVNKDWNSITLADVVMRTARGAGLDYESLEDEYGRRSSLILIATQPESVRIIESIFDIAP